ncbi:hypothetical protein [Bacterioplanoides sp.]|uniref:hypothetical protein n=1 Tax=Bacterioplanoides sp. TaxID=2066072 RepID=UPI003B595F3A
MITKKFSALLLALYCLPSLAGGVTWQAEVTFIQVIGEAATIKLENKQNEIISELQNCSPLVVKAAYEGEPWYQFGKTWSNNTSREQYIKALNKLIVAEENHLHIQFGYVGEGLVADDSDKPCEVESRALMILDDAIISFNQAI